MNDQEPLTSPADDLKERVRELERIVELHESKLALAHRDAAIAAALERVRDRSMAMQGSNELPEVTVTVFQQLKSLGVNFDYCYACILNEKEKYGDFWGIVMNRNLPSYRVRLPITEDRWLESAFSAWKEDASTRSFTLEGEWVVKNRWQALFDLSGHAFFGAGPPPKVTREEHLLAYHRYGFLSIVSFAEPFPEDVKSLLIRFAHIFEQSFTRYLDLRHSELRSREAKRKASLERVRGEIASMRNAEDLDRITPLIWRELNDLGVPFYRCGVLIMDDQSERIDLFISTPQGASLGKLSVPYDRHPTARRAAEHWRDQSYFLEEWDANTFKEWIDLITQEGLIQASERQFELENPPQKLALHFTPFKQGMLYIGYDSPPSDAQADLVQRLASAFSNAYTRYEDFKQLEETAKELKSTQAQLIHAEKMASLGQLTAGIAHEIKNPLNFINNFAQINIDLTEELKEEFDEDSRETDVLELLDALIANATKIKEHGERADNIVRSMMQHASGSIGDRHPIAINALVEEYVTLAYHGWKAHHGDISARGEVSPGIRIVRDYSPEVGLAEVVPQEIGRVLVNLLNNAFDAMQEETSRQRNAPDDEEYKPMLLVSTRREEDDIRILIRDNGPGIADDVRERIFEPFYTTKPAGMGTGLGLSLSFDIITKGHNGTLTVESTAGEGAAFTITLPA